MVGYDATVDAYALSSDFDQRLSAPERSNNPAQIGFDTREERSAARVAQAGPHDGRSTMEQQWMAKSSSFVMMAAPIDLAWARMVGSGADKSPQSATCSHT
jgi:hypothetical protein